MKCKKLFVGGTFDDSGGRRSKIIGYIANELTDGGGEWSHYNGGSLYDLGYCHRMAEEADVVVWMPNVSNDVMKVAPTLKLSNPTCVLVTSKNCLTAPYDAVDVVKHALRCHSALVVRFSRMPAYGDRIVGQLLDPLGNEYSCTTNFTDLGFALKRRLDVVEGMMRLRSRGRTPKEDESFPQPNGWFIETVKGLAEHFHKMVPGAVHEERMLGNASTRCAWGFPSMREENGALVTPRNVDKRGLVKEAFIPARIRSQAVGGAYVQYVAGGGNKPSVDTPIQLELYRGIPWVRYIVHGHCYVEDAPMTDLVLPCGDLRESVEVLQVVRRQPNLGRPALAVNLKGHGCVLLADSVDGLSGPWKFIPRPFPEVQGYDKEGE